MDLDLISRQTKKCPKVTCGSILHESALGGIYYAKGKSTKCIIKTFNLNEQNIYCVARTPRSTVRGLTDTDILYCSNSKKDAIEWMYTWCTNLWPERKNYRVTKIAWVDGEDIGRDGATKLKRINEYMNEAIVGLIISQLPLPHIVKTHESYINDGVGHIVQDYSGHSLQNSMVDLSIQEFKSVIMQILITLAVAQDSYFFKHHDVHLENIFISKNSKEIFQGKALSDYDTWAYTVNGQNFYIQHHGVLAKLGDYGLSAITDPATKIRYERFDYAMLNAGEAEWGEWSGNLQGRMSYDVAVLLSKFFLKEEMGLCPKENVDWAQSLYIALQKENKMECTNIGRPLQFKEGNMKISDLLSHSIFDEFKNSKPDSLKLI